MNGTEKIDIPIIKKQFGTKCSYAEILSLWQGDITRLTVGAIVNAANSQMLGCFVPYQNKYKRATA